MNPLETDHALRSSGNAFHAHSLPGDSPEEKWQLLAQHLEAVARMAADNAQWFNGMACASAAGLLHDLGKYTREFQDRIRGAQIRVDHATWGAKLAIDRFGPIGYLIAYAIAGHHAGLANGEGEGSRTNLADRLSDPTLPTLLDAWQSELSVPGELVTPTSLRPRNRDQGNFTAAFLVRMLFSCLVDADYLDTEDFYAKAEGRAVPRGASQSMARLQVALNDHLHSMAQSARPSDVNRERQRILEHVRNQATLPPGLFSLTVPTGGGKTLTSLAFGLDHAVTHGLRRVIYVIPFTSGLPPSAGWRRRRRRAGTPQRVHRRSAPGP